MKKLTIAGGCFWGVQAFFDSIPGVIKTSVGYMHGPAETAYYEAVCKSSGHAEVVYIEYEETKTSLKKLLEYFYSIINPYSINKQGGDEGIQYRTGIYYYDENDKIIVKNFIKEKQTQTDKKISIEIKAADTFYPGEEYHQKYLEKNPAGYCHINLTSALNKIGIKK